MRSLGSVAGLSFFKLLDTYFKGLCDVWPSLVVRLSLLHLAQLIVVPGLASAAILLSIGVCPVLITCMCRKEQTMHVCECTEQQCRAG